jgi:hypothetical protein
MLWHDGSIVLVPLDERPVNTGLVADVAAIAGVRLALPPDRLLPSFRTPAPLDGLASWVTDAAGSAGTSALVVSLDTLVHGGLIPARTSTDPVETVVGRMQVLRRIRRERPGLRISAVSLVTRASDSYSNVEEPDYWSDHGRDLHGLGSAAHRAWRDRAGTPASDIPPDVRSDFALRRLRNHIVNLAAMALSAEGVLDRLVITADDTAEFSAGSVEQEWLRYWSLLDESLDVPVYPGADETGAVLLANALCALTGVSPRVRVLSGDPDGWERIPPYENAPLGTSVPRQVGAAGGIVVDGEADLILVIHASDPDRRDQFATDAPIPDVEAVDRTVAKVTEAMETGLPVALADLRYSNGADPGLMAALRDRRLLGGLAAYAGWNTAGNALGSVIALGVATVVGRRTGKFDAAAAKRALCRRLLDDWAYQAEVRRAMAGEYFDGRIDPRPSEAVTRAEAELLLRLRAAHRALGVTLPAPVSVTLPWKRSFEVDIRLDGDPAR